jgi:hypothetical protein
MVARRSTLRLVDRPRKILNDGTAVGRDIS